MLCYKKEIFNTEKIPAIEAFILNDKNKQLLKNAIKDNMQLKINNKKEEILIKELISIQVSKFFPSYKGETYMIRDGQTIKIDHVKFNELLKENLKKGLIPILHDEKINWYKLELKKIEENEL